MNKIQDMSILYELALLIGQSLDLEENCEGFLGTLLARENLAFAGLWLNKSRVTVQKTNKASLVYAKPACYVKKKTLPLDHPIYNLLAHKKYHLAELDQMNLGQVLKTERLPNGSSVFFNLNNIGLLLLISLDDTYFSDKIRIPMLQKVISKFAVSLEGCLAQQRHTLEIKQREKVEQELRRAYASMEDRIAERTSQLEKANKELMTEIEKSITTEERLRRHNEYLTSLHVTSLGLMNRLNLEELLEDIVIRAGNLIGTPHGYIYLYDPAEKFFMRVVGLGVYADDLGRRINLGRGMVSEVYKTAQPLIIDNYSQWKERNRGPLFEKLGSVLQVPLKSGSQVTGIIGLAFLDRGRKFQDEEVQLVSRFAELASIALDNARLYSAAQSELAERTRAEAALRESEAENEALINAIPDQIYRISRDGYFLAAKIGKDPSISGDYLGKSISNLYPADLTWQIMQYIKRALSTNKMQTHEYKHLFEGIMRIWESRMVAVGEDSVLAIVRDITERKRMEEQLEYLSLYDSLTGLHNRNYFQQEMANLESKNSLLGIVICDVDGLKLVNDTLGHDNGDRLLITVANMLRSCFPKNATIARIGGDEYAVLLPNHSQQEVEKYCRLMRETIVMVNKYTPGLPLSVSLGFATSNQEGGTVKDLFKAADNSMYREKLHHIQSSRSAIVQTLMKALEARDFMTEGHALRLEKLVTDMAQSLGLAESNTTDLRLLAQFHDIGKVGIKDSILFKPGPLLPEELKEMHRHCEIGYRIALSAPELAPISGWILKHHEWWDGNGYPLGLKGEEIPLECRILAIVDAYDAMISNRPYRKALSPETAIAELKKYSGSQFEPRLVTIFINILNDKSYSI